MSEGERGTRVELASVVARRRAELQLTQQQAADRAGVAVTTWRMIEGGRQTSFRTLTMAAVARALEWDVDRLLDPAEHHERTEHGDRPPRESVRGDGLVELMADQMRNLSARDLLLIQALLDRLAEDGS